jgi:hypothetical protein
MEKEFIPYGLAVKLKELGFDEPCFGSYYNYSEENFKEGELGYDYRGELNIGYSEYYYGIKYYILAPTWQQAFRWFRQEHNLKFHIREDVWNNWCSLKMIRHDDYISIGEYKTYEEAELTCLTKLIEIVENEKTL